MTSLSSGEAGSESRSLFNTVQILGSRPPQQVEHLQERGLHIPDTARAQLVLRRVGLYRLKSFLLPYKTPAGYVPGTSFADAERLMKLDEALRLHVFGAMQTVEVGVRQAIVQWMLERHGLRWYADPVHFHEPNEYLIIPSS
ncbi:Abi family protein [Deinococcus knuensis]|uniref:Abi family protein n=1 Tax=Deinococcus knuensis TaxID=1837380 RepID=A0ABQ2SZ70_9DEIO|nr:Abi family protein [Deinococcus knuensis]GGS44780.1 hypothetical protein GCM10008961_39340 [Deinococcus knuensis]